MRHLGSFIKNARSDFRYTLKEKYTLKMDGKLNDLLIG